MASEVLSIELSGFPEIEKRANQIANFDFNAVLDEGSAIIFNRIRTRYLQAVDPEGVPWIVSQASLDRAAKGIGGLTGYDSGTLFHSLQLFKTDDLTREIGTDVPYAGFFQYSPKGQRPRIYLGFGNEDQPLMERLVILRLEEALSD